MENTLNTFEITRRIALLSPERRAAFAKLCSRDSGVNGIAPAASDNREYPMSFAQRRLWFLHRLDPANPAYNCPVPLRLRGDLNTDALIDSVRDIVARHDVLRSVYSMHDQEPVQRVGDAPPLAVMQADLAFGTDSDRMAALERRIAADAERPFDLEHGSSIRVELLRLAADDHVLLFDIHHVANDHASIRVFFDELAAGYNARLAGRQPCLPGLPVQYADFAVWQHRRITASAEGEALWSYWRHALSGMESVDLPTDRIRGSELSHRGAIRRFELPPPLVARLREIGRSEGATLFMTLLAGFLVLLARYTGKTDVSVGCSATGRDRAELQALIGFFVNTIVLRADLDEVSDCRALLRQARRVVTDAFAHAEFPFDLLVKRMNPQRCAARMPLVPVMFTLDDTPETLPPFTGLTAEVIEPSFTTTKFDLLVSARSRGDGVYGHFQYSTDLFEAETIDRMVDHYEAILTAIAEDPQRAWQSIPMLSEAERYELLVRRNATVEPFPQGRCLHHLIDAQGVAGERPAVITPSGTLTYSQLVERADALAAELRAAAAGPDVPVAVFLEPSADFVIGILAVLKASATYLPVDPARGIQQVDPIVREFAVTMVLSRREVPGFVPARRSGMLWCRSGTEPSPTGAAVRPATARDLAYVICTSGSTGAPKAIALEHQGVVNNLHDINRRFSVGPDDRVLFLSSPAFDMSVYETLGMLLAGAAVVVPEPQDLRAPWRWTRHLLDHGITIWNSAPVLLELLVDELERNGPAYLPHLRLVLLGGDWIPVTLPDRLRAFAPNCEIISLGGATEASIHSTIHAVRESYADRPSIPYGRPMANQRTYILDPWGNPVPIGVPGELHLAGTGLARGYLGRPELTAERFVIRPLAETRERLFKTGDEARWKSDGTIELLGRLDFQVKIHGQRVELRAVEHVLRSDPTVQDAIVIAFGNGTKRAVGLTAYVVVRDGKTFSASRTRAYMAAQLPFYMLPAAFVTVERFPTNGSGKVDRMALSRQAARRSGKGQAAPADDPLERELLHTWQQLLGVPDLSIDDDLFELGCDSFKAIQAARLIGRGMRVIEIYKAPTVRSLCSHLRTQQFRRPQTLHRLTAPEAQASLCVVAVPYGGGSAASYARLAKALPEHAALWSVALPGHDPGDSGDPLRPIDDVVRDCLDQMTALSICPDVIYGHCAGAPVAIALAQRLESQGAAVGSVVLGAALLDADPETTLGCLESRGDGELEAHIRGLGGLGGDLDRVPLTRMLAAARHDLAESARFLLRSRDGAPNRLKAPVLCVFGEHDPATADFADRYRAWGRFADDLRCTVIAGAGHYFAESHAESLADAIVASRSTGA